MQVSIDFAAIHQNDLTHAWNGARSVLDFLSHVNSAVNAL